MGRLHWREGRLGYSSLGESLRAKPHPFADSEGQLVELSIGGSGLARQAERRERTMGAIAVEVATSRVSSPSQSIREYVERMFVQKSAEGDNGLNHIFPDSLPPERGLVVSGVCRAIRPKATLEVGMAWGISTLLI